MSKKEEKKEKIIEKAKELFNHNGYEETKVEDITRDLGISKGNFYTYFNSKRDVLLEILDKIEEEWKKNLEEIDITEEPKKVLKEFVFLKKNFAEENIGKINSKNLEKIWNIEEVAKKGAINFKDSMEFLRKNVVSRCNKKNNKKYDEEFISDFILSSIENFIIEKMIYRKEKIDEESISKLIEFIGNSFN